MAYTASDMVNVTRQEIFTTGLQERFDYWLLGQRMVNDRTAQFPDGDVAEFDQIGQRAPQDYAENTPIDFSKIDTSRIQLRLDTHLQDGFYITDKQKRDSWKAAEFWAANVRESIRGFGNRLETDILATCMQQVIGDKNEINGSEHRRVAPAANSNQLTLDDIRRMKLSFDKARVPAQGRVLLIDPSQEFVLNGLVDLTRNVNDANFSVEGMINSGFGDRLEFLTNFYGFNIMISHNLPKGISETIDGEAITGGVANIALSMASSDSTPFMGVYRHLPTSEFFRNTTLKRDEWSTTAEYGHALQRPEALYVLITTEEVA